MALIARGDSAGMQSACYLVHYKRTSNDNATPNADDFSTDVAQKRPANGSISRVIFEESRRHGILMMNA